MSTIRERYMPGGDKYEAMRADLAWERTLFMADIMWEQAEEAEDDEDEA